MIHRKIENVESEAQKSPINAKAEGRILSPFCFYEALGYPIPSQAEFFVYQQKMQSEKKEKKSDFSSFGTGFSRDEMNPYHQEYLAFLKEWSWLYSQFPFVEAIYLANSMSFNALHADSDIDVFVVTQERRVWLARLFMTLIMWIFHIKRSGNIVRKRFCLSFFVDSSHQNLKSLLLHEQDIYLPYWIAHLVPLYLLAEAGIYEENLWVQDFLPYWEPRQVISSGVDIKRGKGLFRKILEVCFSGGIGDFFEGWVKKFWSFRIRSLVSKKPELHRGVIFSDHILKFHNDKRDQYSQLVFGKR